MPAKISSLGWRFSRNVIIFLIFLGALFFLYSWRLGSYLPGMSTAEKIAITNSNSLSAIRDNPTYAPHKLVQYSFQYFGLDDLVWMRSVSVIFAVVFLAAFYLLASQWFGRFIGYLGTFILATIPLVIILARNATPNILFLAPVAIMALFIWLSRTSKWQTLAWLLLILTTAFALYIPGMAWFVLISFILGYRKIIKSIPKVNKTVLIISIVLSVLLLIPLGWAIAKDMDVLRVTFLIPDAWAGALDLVKNLGWSALALVYKYPVHEEHILGRLAALNIAIISLALIGLYAMWNKARHEIYMLAILIFTGVVLASLNRSKIFLMFTLPVITVFATAGLRYLFLRWMRIFPSNPIPRAFALTIVVGLVCINVAYGIRYAHIAWPHNTEIRNIYMLK